MLLLGIRVAGVEFAPKDLIFAAAEPRSRAVADGALVDGCKWTFVAETRVATREDEKSCVRYFYKTTVSLEQACPAPSEKKIVRLAERITASSPQCPDASGKLPPPQIDAKVLSSGITADGKRQDIVVQPDGTRITLTYDDSGATCVASFADGSTDVLALAAR
jgi:YD repeat-containing protein